MLDRPEVVTYYAEQTDERFRPTGVAGGRTRRLTVTVIGPDGPALDLAQKATVEVAPGTIVRVETSGGGGTVRRRFRHRPKGLRGRPRIISAGSSAISRGSPTAMVRP